MTNPTRIRATVKDGITEVRARMSHAMETGQRKTAAGGLVPAHFITDLTVHHGDRVVLSAQFGPSVSANPYLAFKFRGGAAGERVRVSWIDNKGESRSDEAEIA
ncbi:thiosulfate oxidation carrier complex protein SoxZ [Thauera sinica]|uniref:Thiosulfate oxidation carrier complex protein SoxZ n=1 Tax=Thauera sinica TaxID=2665146 RepID=A0ABW1AL35_9RHOO|nr:thiosulfate oxidation carrier complex protein SoxZ [Thauera sp. K11]ATE60743.1 thiosulfate oxidation carrier complex protein SoxZ [Thauera sp. K11]